MMLPRRRVVMAVLLAGGLFALLTLPGRALEHISLSLGTVNGAGWSARAVTARVGLLDAGYAALVVQAERLTLPEGLGTLANVTLSCERARLTATLASCEQGTLAARSSLYGAQTIQTAFRYRLDSGDLDAGLAGIAVQGGELTLTITLQSGGWQLTARAAALSLPAVMGQLASFDIELPVIEGDGRVDLTVRARGQQAQLEHADIEARLRAREFTDPDGSLAAENLDATLHASVRQGRDDRLQVELGLTGKQGALYVDPLFINIPDRPIQVQAHLDYLPATQRLSVHAFSYTHPGSVRLTASGQLDLAADSPLTRLQLDVQAAQFPAAFDTYLQPWLYDTGFAELDTRGSVQAAITIEQGAVTQLTVDPQALTVDDREGRFELQAMNGALRWSDSPDPLQSSLSWAGGSVFDVALGPTELLFEANHDTLRLRRPAEIPVLDGALRIDSFQMGFAASAPLHWQVNGLLEPISLSELTLALGWPELSGMLSGVIPDIHYDDGNLEVGGILLVRVFDGEITLRNLTLEQPFGLVPRLQVDARATNIDLKILTRTFSFGRIEGRLNGRIDGLDMVSWRPVAFDAEFATPEGDDSRHRISQKAVDNISSIGGAGMSGALSRSFLRFFEDFPYNRLGISCRLHQGVCDMGGVAPAADGYYLVKGRLIPPRLDVIGFAERVNWDTLIAQIMAVTSQQDVVVE